MVGAEDVDRAVEAALELVDEIRDVGGEVRRRPVRSSGRATRSFSSPYADRARPERAVLLVRVEPRQQLGQPLLDLALARPRVEVDAEALERLLDLLAASPATGSPGSRASSSMYVAVVAVLGRLLPAPHRLDRRAEAVHLRAGVVVVVLALDVVPANSSRRATESPYAPFRADATVIGPVGFADTISTWTRSAARPSRRRTPSPASRIARERVDEPRVGEEEVDEARAGDLGALDLGQRLPPQSASSAASSRGACRRAPASRSAAFVA